jgi:hypothetical protein
MLKRGFGIMIAKVGIATLIAVSVGKFFGGDLFGFSTLALLVAMSDTNGGMFMALTSVMGDKEDAGTYVPQSIETGPFLTMVILERFPVWLNRDSHGRRNSGVFGQRFGFERVPWPGPIRRTCASAL